MIPIFIIVLLWVAFIRNITSEERRNASLSVLMVSYLSYFIYDFGPYDRLVESVGYYGVQSFYLFSSVLFLYLFKSKVSLVLMVLFTAGIGVNLVFFLLELLYDDLWTIYQVVVWAMFVIQMAILFSERVTDGFFSYVARILGRVTKTSYLDSGNTHFSH